MSISPIKLARLRSKRTQQDLARALGLSESTISKIETFRQTIDRDVALVVAAALNLSFKEVMEAHGSPKMATATFAPASERSN